MFMNKKYDRYMIYGAIMAGRAKNQSLDDLMKRLPRRLRKEYFVKSVLFDLAQDGRITININSTTQELGKVTKKMSIPKLSDAMIKDAARNKSDVNITESADTVDVEATDIFQSIKKVLSHNARNACHSIDTTLNGLREMINRALPSSSQYLNDIDGMVAFLNHNAEYLKAHYSIDFYPYNTKSERKYAGSRLSRIFLFENTFLSNQIKLKRLQANLTQIELFQLTDVPNSKISSIERNIGDNRGNIMAKYAKEISTLKKFLEIKL